MIDGSTLPLEGNIALTRSVVEAAGDLPVEAELGTVGGKEDGHEAKPQYTDPQEAVRFVRETGITSFAVAIGTAHGVYKGRAEAGYWAAGGNPRCGIDPAGAARHKRRAARSGARLHHARAFARLITPRSFALRFLMA